MSDKIEIKPLFDEPINSPYWDRIGMKSGRKILGHALNEFEQNWMEHYEGPGVLRCSESNSYQMDWDNMVIWRYWIK